MMTNKGREKKARLFLLFSFLIFIFSFVSCKFGFDERPEERAGAIVPVSGITGVPAIGEPYVITPLSAAVLPENATNKKIVWSIKSDGGTRSTLEGSRLTAAAEGTVTVTATIANGLATGVDYTEDFAIRITLTAQFPVTNIAEIPDALPIGDKTYVLNGVVEPSNAAYQNIVWTVADAGTTGAAINVNFLTATGPGTVKIRATIENGLLEKGAYTQEFSILITRSVIASGMYNFGDEYNKKYQAVYWIDGEFHELPNAGAGSGTIDEFYNSISVTSGVVIANGKHYIAGYYSTGSYTNVCYWVDGVEKPLTDGTGSSSTTTRTFNIAEGGGYVYILGVVQDKACYWKIDPNTDTVAEKITLLKPDNTPFSPYDVYLRNESFYFNIAVSNSGRVVLGSRIDNLQYGSGGVCYWDSNTLAVGGNSITGERITALDTYSEVTITAAGFVNGDVYFAGSLNTTNNVGGPYVPYYYRLTGTGGVVSVMPASKNPSTSSYAWISGVASIIDQNGSPVFYAGFTTNISSYYYYWDTAWNITRLSAASPRLDRIVYSDGEVYIPSTASSYMVLWSREPFLTRVVGSPAGITWASLGNYVTGIAVLE